MEPSGVGMFPTTKIASGIIYLILCKFEKIKKRWVVEVAAPKILQNAVKDIIQIHVFRESLFSLDFHFGGFRLKNES